MVVLLWLHAAGLTAFAIYMGFGLQHSLLETSPLVAAALLCGWPGLARDLRTNIAAVGLFTSSAILVHLSGGKIEMHFHFFVLLGIIALYEHWTPFLLGIGFVLLHHGILGTLEPDAIYNHPDAIENPWQWATIHALFVLAASTGILFFWREGERARESALNEASRLEKAERRFRSMAQNASEIVAVFDADQVITHISPSVEKLTGYQPDELIGRRSLDMIHGDDELGRRRLLQRPGESVKTEFRWQHRDGSWIDLEAIVTNLTEDPAVQGYVVNSRDITERKRFEAELRERAFYDTLTGLPNRALFEDRLAHALSLVRRGVRETAVLFIDLDHFKLVNDSLGHSMGDELLVKVSQRFQSCVRATDTVARFGGDEFALLLEPLSSEQEAVDVARRILNELKSAMTVSGRSVFVTPSIGIAFVNGTDVPGASELMKHADIAMYATKSRGRAGYTIFDDSMLAGNLRQLDMQTDFLEALAEKRLDVFFQPEVELESGRVLGVEALARWPQPDGSYIPPSDFIPIAEETGTIVELGKFVLERSCSLARLWRDVHGQDLPFSVNASARELRQEDFVHEVVRVLSEHSIQPELLTIEVTENVALEDSSAIISTLHQLKASSVKIAVDDFGAGYSPLAQLSNIRPNLLKIDRSFISGLPDTDSSLSVVRALVALAAGFDMSVTAEGIETIEQANVLELLGCRRGQGFYYARPMSGDALIDYLETAALEVESAA